MSATDAGTLLHAWLDARLDDAGRDWLAASVAVLADGGDRALFTRVSQVARRLGKAPLRPEAAERAAAAALRPGWDPAAWTIDQAARVRLLLAMPGDAAEFRRRLDLLCASADLDELVAFYRGLPLYPDAPSHRARAGEGLRSSMTVVFEAVALANPYPAEQLPEPAWNQMVLKALFVGSRLDAIVGLDARANAALARMLRDYAHERWAARRPVSPELWRCVGPFADQPGALDDLRRVLTEGAAAEQAAAVLALEAAPGDAARRLLDDHALLRDAVRARGARWSLLTDPA